MAIVSQHRTRRQGTFESQRVAVRRRQPRRWVKRVVLGGALLATVVLLLPNIIAATGLRNAPLRMALAGIRGSVTTGGASLSWFGAIRYTDIEIRDAEGKPLLVVPSVESERTLIGLIGNLNNLGTFRIERPQVSLTLRQDGSNAEDIFKPVIEKAEKSPRVESEILHPLAMTVEIVDGTIQLTDATTNQQWKFEKFNFKLRTSPESVLPVEVALSGNLVGSETASQIAITGKSIEGRPNGAVLDEVEAKIDALPLAALRPLADRFAPGLQMAGTVSTNLICTGIAGIPSGKLTVMGGVTASNFSATGGPLGTDRFVQQRVELPCKMAYQNRQLEIEQFGLVCDVGNLSVVGAATIPESFDDGMMAKLLRSTFQIQGQLDLAKFAALLPRTLRVQQGTQITAGQISITLSSKPDADAHTWSGRLLASNLSAVQNGRPLEWHNPIDLQLAARDQQGHYSIDQLVCQSDFLSLHGGGSLDGLQIEANYDLNRLMAEAGQFVDLGELKLAGQGNAQLRWSRAATGEFTASAGAQVKSLEIALPGRKAWQEELVSAALTAAGSVAPIGLENLAAAKVQRLNNAQATLTLDNPAQRSRELIEVKLLQPVESFTAQTRWPMDVRVQGRLDRLWPQVAAWLGVTDLELGGTADITLLATYNDAAIEIQNAKATLNQLHAWGWNTFFIDEPEVRLEVSGGYQFAAHKLTLNRTSLLTSSLSMQTDEAAMAFPPNGPMNLQGAIGYRADMGRLLRWITDPRSPPSYALVGVLSGSTNMARNGSVTDGRVDATLDNFAVYVYDAPAANGRNAAPQPEMVWSEPRLTLAASSRLDDAADRLQLAGVNIVSQAFTMNAAGGIERLSTEKEINLAGKIDYDWDSIGPLLKPYLGNGVKIVGKHTRKFSVQGPLSEIGDANLGTRLASATKGTKLKGGADPDSFATLRPLTADVSLGFSRADVYGMRLGKLDFNAHMQDGTILLQPMETTIGREAPLGQLSVTPTVRLTPQPAELTIGKGVILNNVRISQELSHAWMKFLVPALAEASRAEGSFSLELDGAKVPLMKLKSADVSGKLVVHEWQVLAGPALEPLVLAAQQIEAMVDRRPPPLALTGQSSLLKIGAQKVDFSVTKGRVYHQDFQMQIGKVPVRTRGWVGFDESVGLVAEITIQDEWIRKVPALGGIQDRILRIPIEGNLHRWKFDGRIIQSLIGQAVTNVVPGIIEGELNKQLNRLFPVPQR
ncbi:MAG: hypothetical protein IT427_01595 [Pirellulales bacterium]|nr:hypothetical protein [Pirellulales bacterium]